MLEVSFTSINIFIKPVFTVNVFVFFFSAICSRPLYVLQISDSVRVIKGTPRQEFDDADTCCSGFLITSANTTTCLENGEWELDTSQMNCDCEG